MLVQLLKVKKDKVVRKNNMSKYNLQDLLEGMSDEEFANAQEKDRLEKHPERDKIKAIQALLAKEKGMKEDLLSKDGDNEDNVDNIDKVASPDAKGKGYDSSVAAQSKESGDEMDQITQTTKPMYKENKVPSLEEVYNIDRKGNEKPDTDGSDASKYKKAARDMKEARVDRDVAERIEGMLSIPLKRKFLDTFMDLWQDLIEEDPFYAEDVINHLNNEMHKEIDGYQAMGDRLNSIPMEENGDVKDYAEEIKEDDKKKLMDAAAKMIKDRILKDIPMDIVVDFVKTHFDDIKGMDNSEIEDEFENFRSVNYDYIDEDLKEHFNRFK